ncbi:MAG: PEP-CTERM sorting domain-containing protein [Armatimonadota bacterium]
MNTQKRSGCLRAASLIVVIVTLLAASCISAWASVSAYTAESADFYPGNTGVTIPGFDESLSQYDPGTAGVATASYNYPTQSGDDPPPPFFYAGVDTVTADKGYSTYAYVNESAGILKAYASTWLQVRGAMTSMININTHAGASAEISDTIILSAPATLLLSGNVSGCLGGSSNYSNYDVFQKYIWTPMSVDSWVRFSYRTSGEEGSSSQGFEAYFDQAGNISNPFSVPIYLPANTPITVSAGLNITTTVDPDTSTILGVSWRDKVGPLTSITGNIWADFANTMDFGIQVPDGVTVTSESGLLPLQTAAVPEPSALLALGSGLGLLGTCFRRRQ